MGQEGEGTGGRKGREWERMRGREGRGDGSMEKRSEGDVAETEMEGKGMKGKEEG